MKNKIYISNKLHELIAFLKKELKKPITILEPKDYERPIPKPIDNLKPIDRRTDGGFVAYLDQFNTHHCTDCAIQKAAK